jgi:hypothetical protein
VNGKYARSSNGQIYLKSGDYNHANCNNLKNFLRNQKTLGRKMFKAHNLKNNTWHFEWVLKVVKGATLTASAIDVSIFTMTSWCGGDYR